MAAQSSNLFCLHLQSGLTKGIRKSLACAIFMAAIFPRIATPRSAGQTVSGTAVSRPDTVQLPVRVMDFRSAAGPFVVIFRYTPLVPGAAGQADVQPVTTRADVELVKTAWRLSAVFSNLPPASKLGGEYLAWVLWGVSPEGRTYNLGEIILEGTEGHINAKIKTLRFGLIVTAEPYFAVSQPGKAVALEADLGPGESKVPVTEVTCKLLATSLGYDPATARPAGASDPVSSLRFEEARRAIDAARRAGAEQYAPDTLHAAEKLLRLAQDRQASGAPAKDVTDTSNEAVLIAEDARVLAVARSARRAPATKAPLP